MRTITLLGILLSFPVALAAGEIEWHGTSDDNRIGGRMISSGYLRGKVVMVDCRDYGSRANKDVLPRLQSIWSAYKSKPFILVGSHRGQTADGKIGKLMEKMGLTFPVYRDFGVASVEKGRKVDEELNSFIYVLDETGKVAYFGTDDRAAMGVVGSSLMNMAAPRSVKEWKHFLDWETKNIPGRAYLRLKDFEAQHPAEAKEAYGEVMEKLENRPEIKKLSKLVAAAKLVKDRDPNSAASQKVTKDKIEILIEKYEPLKQCRDPNVVQEAKNALAELKWASATLSK